MCPTLLVPGAGARRAILPAVLGVSALHTLKLELPGCEVGDAGAAALVPTAPPQGAGVWLMWGLGQLAGEYRNRMVQLWGRV